MVVLAGCGGGRAFTRAVRRVRGSGRGYGGGPVFYSQILRNNSSDPPLYPSMTAESYR